MQIVQKRKSRIHTYTFKDESFNFAYQSKHGSGDLDLDYADIESKPFVEIDRNDWLRNVGYIWLIVGAIQLGVAIYAELPLSGKGFWILLGIACLAFEYFSRTKYSVLRVDRWNIYIIHDKQHDQIMQLLTERKKSKLLGLYGDINLQNSLESEIHKYRWLEKEGVLTHQESEMKIAQAEKMFQEDLSHSGHSLN